MDGFDTNDVGRNKSGRLKRTCKEGVRAAVDKKGINVVLVRK